MKYFVRTTGERQLDSSYSQIEYELLIDRECKPVKSLVEHYKYISKFDSVVLEDDLILCENFKNQIEDVINQYPDKIINFFFQPKNYFECGDKKYENDFHYAQCRYYPKDITDKIAKWLEEKEYLDKPRAMPFVTEACNNLRYTVFQYRPCLVQHIDNNSLVDRGKCFRRRSPYFVDYLNELGITYDKAYEYRKELITLMKSKFERP